MFVLSLTSGQAKEVFYLGHEPGSVASPPVVIDRFLVVAENDGIENATLNVLSLEGDGEEPSIRLLQKVPVRGHFQTSPQVSGLRLLATSDQGDIYVFEISGADPEKPLGLIAQGKAADDKDQKKSKKDKKKSKKDGKSSTSSSSSDSKSE